MGGRLRWGGGGRPIQQAAPRVTSPARMTFSACFKHALLGSTYMYTNIAPGPHAWNACTVYSLAANRLHRRADPRDSLLGSERTQDFTAGPVNGRARCSPIGLSQNLKDLKDVGVQDPHGDGACPWFTRSPCTQATRGFGSATGVPRYRGTSLIRNSACLGPYSRTMPRALWWS